MFSSLWRDRSKYIMKSFNLLVSGSVKITFGYKKHKMAIVFEVKPILDWLRVKVF